MTSTRTKSSVSKVAPVADLQSSGPGWMTNAIRLGLADPTGVA